MFEKIWNVKTEYDKTINAQNVEEFFDILCESLEISPEEKALMGRNLVKDLESPFLLPDMDKCVDRISEAVDIGEHIVIFGDYDCDGITATAILYDFLTNQLEADAEYMLPSRFKEGYGLSKNAIDIAKKFNTGLIITVDNGISCKDEIDYANELGIDVVITDHHEIPEILPNAFAICNPHLPESKFTTDFLCGAGVAFELVFAISVSLGLDDYYKYLPYAAIGTVGDMMKLRLENRLIVTLGIEYAADTEFCGLTELLKDLSCENGKNLTSETISFGISPKLNSAGRMGDPDAAIELLLTRNNLEAQSLLAGLNSINNKRKSEEDKIVKACLADEKYLLTKLDSNIIIARGDDWNPGLCGLVAGTLMNRFDRPSIVFCNGDSDETGKKQLKASSRSIDGINIYEILKQESDLLVKFGGHEKAAGFSIYEENPDEFVRRSNEICGKMREKMPIVTKKDALIYVPEKLLTLELANKIKSLEPFGEGFARPLFYTDGLTVAESKTIGRDGKHLSITFVDKDNFAYRAVAFSEADFADNFFEDEKGGIVFNLDKSEYNGITKLDLKLKDFVENYSIENKFAKETYRLTMDELRNVYKLAKNVSENGKFARKKLYFAKKNICADARYDCKVKNSFTWFKLDNALKIFEEIGYIKKLDGETFEFSTAGTEKKPEDIELFRELLTL